ncbi:MAG: ATP-dependent helicase HrpB [Acidobacteriota bacterium]
MPPLPIDPLLPEILQQLRRGRNLVIVAAPGAGKTTRIPPALLDAFPGEILVLEPRRLAARLAARRVAAERGERAGQTAGYRVRFEDVTGPATRLVFMTEGVLTRRLLSDPALRGVGTVVLDEFHERHLEGDLALALLRRLQRTSRPDLRLVVMSATLEAGPVAAYLGGCPVLRSEGRQFEISISYTPSSPAPLEEQVAAAVSTLARETPGDVLVFLPGAAEIRRAARACAGSGLLVLPLHGDLSPEEQDRAVQPAERRKAILSTNVAESSITIEGVTGVADSGLARVASQSPWSGLPRLEVRRIGKASANQRAGRAGRTAPGRVIRLYSLEDFARRPEQDASEIARAELSQTVLVLRALGIAPAELNWLEAPPERALAAAEELLERLGALGPDGRLMLRMPVHPRLARLALDAARGGARDQGAAAAALLGAGARLPAETRHAGASDLLALIDSEWDRHSRLAYEELRRILPRAGAKTEDALARATLAAFPDRVARRRRDDELQLAGGGSAVLARSSVVRAAPFLVAVDIEERRERGLPLVRLASAIEPEWLLDLFPERVRERRTLEWNRAGERVDAVSALTYGELVIEESRGAPRDEDEPWRLLAERAVDAGAARFADAGEIAAFLDRVAFAARYSAVPELTDADVREALVSLCEGLRSFAELASAARDGGLLGALERRLPAGAAAAVREMAPATLRLPGGKQVRVEYPRNEAPRVAAKLQEFFGMEKTPAVARGQAPLVVYLLAPNNRPVQTTTDLAGFWRRLYPEVRRELSRRYPRHRWPENPLEAAPGERRR